MVTTRTDARTAEDMRGFAAKEAARERRCRQGRLCPECGETDDIDDNGCEGPDRVWQCGRCHSQWDGSFGREG